MKYDDIVFAEIYTETEYEQGVIRVEHPSDPRLIEQFNTPFAFVNLRNITKIEPRALNGQIRYLIIHFNDNSETLRVTAKFIFQLPTMKKQFSEE